MMLRNQIRMDEAGEIRQDLGDMLNLNAPIEMPNGSFIFDSRITRSGILRYRNDDDGSERIEYRPPEEVQAALEFMAGIPVTIGHPGILSADTFKEHTHGAVLNPRLDGDWVRARVVVHTKEALTRMKTEGYAQTSQGYLVDYDPTPGTAPCGTRYDGVQRNIRPNHQAVVKKARAGSNCRVRLDGALVTDTLEQQETPMFKHKDGSTFATQGELDAYSKAADMRDKAIAERDELKGRLDHASQVDHESEINERVRVRRELERNAEKLQSDDKRLDGIEGMSDKDLMIAAIKLHNPDFDGAEMPVGEIRGWFKGMVASHKPAAPSEPQRQDSSATGISKTVKDPRKKSERRPNGMFMSNAERKALSTK